MTWYDDVCREFTDWLHIKAKVIYINIPRHCNELYYQLITAMLPNAFITETGNCDKKLGLKVSIFDLYNAIDQSLSYGQENAYAVLTFPSVEGLPPEALRLIGSLIKYINAAKLRPIVLSFFPQDFMNKTQLYYDELILVSRHMQQRINQKEHDQKYYEMLGTIQKLLEPENYNRSMLEINGILGKAPIEATPMVFFKNKRPEFTINFLDLMAICLLMYGVLCHGKAKKLKPKIY